MVKYCATAMALKGFSWSPFAKKIYRNLGNNFGAKKRASAAMPSYYLERVNRMLHISRRYGVPRNGSKLIELGTGWCHWEAITTKLFFDVHGVLYDVWDNRQLKALKNYVNQLGNSLDKLDINNIQKGSASAMIANINQVTSYNELYELLGFKYILDPSGHLAGVEAESFDVVVSAGVMEHIHAADAGNFVNGISTLLKPGGYSVQSINIRDHLYLYDTSVSPKQYLKYPNWIWILCFENDVQYINRIQRSQWLDLFRRSRLDLIEEEVENEDLTGLNIAAEYRRYEDDDLRCGGLKVVHRKAM